MHVAIQVYYICCQVSLAVKILVPGPLFYSKSVKIAATTNSKLFSTTFCFINFQNTPIIAIKFQGVQK
jgi:hypothetical protein